MEKNLQIEEQKALNEKFIKAVMLGDEEKVVELLDLGANINTTNINGDNAIFIAADRRKLNVFNILMEYISPSGEKINLDNQNYLGETALMFLIKGEGYERYVKELLSNGANPNIVNHNKLSPLIRASGDSKLEIVEALLATPGIDVNYVIPDTLTTAFLMATAHGDFDVTEALFKAGANVNALDKHGKNALINALFKNNSYYTKKEKKKHLDLVMALIQLCDVNYVADSGATAFWIASATKQKEACLLMMEKNVNVDVTHELGLDGKMSALHLWCHIGDPEMIEKIIEKGGKLGVKDSNGNTPEAYAFMRPNLRELMLKNNIDPNTIYYSENSKTPIFSLLISGGDKQIDLVKDMINRGANVAYDSEGLDGYEPIVIAVSSVSRLITKELLSTNKIDVNRLYKVSPTAPGISLVGLLVNGSMHSGLATHLEQKKYYESLLKAKEENEKNGIASDLISKEEFEVIKQNFDNLNKLEESIESYKLDIFRQLVSSGYKINNVNEDGNSEIFFAKKPEYISLLVDHGANLFHENKEGQDVLYYSVLNGNEENITYLKEEFSKEKHKTVNNIFYQLAFEEVNNYIKQKNIEKGLFAFVDYKNNTELQKVFSGKVEEGEILPTIEIKDINYQDDDGNSALLVACANGNGYLVGPYLKMGANINLANNNGETPLMHALSTESNNLVKYLIDNNANINAVNNDGVSVWDMAIELNNKAILDTLRIAFEKLDEEKVQKPKP